MISYYELLGLIKEGKQPRKIKYDSDEYIWDGEIYIDVEMSSSLIQNHFRDADMFEKNIKIIDYVPLKIENIPCRYDEPGEQKMMKHTINELTKAVNYLLEEDKHE